ARSDEPARGSAPLLQHRAQDRAERAVSAVQSRPLLPPHARSAACRKNLAHGIGTAERRAESTAEPRTRARARRQGRRSGENRGRQPTARAGAGEYRGTPCRDRAEHARAAEPVEEIAAAEDRIERLSQNV